MDCSLQLETCGRCNQLQAWELARHIANYDEIIADDWIESGSAAEYDMDSEAKTLLHELFSSGLIYFS